MNVPQWLDRGLYPFEHHYVDTTVGRMHYVDEGSGPTVLMVHGNPAWSFLYRDMIKRLSSRCRCVAPDHIGFGLSDKPADRSILPEEHARNLSALIGSLGLRDITLVVQDWGGPIGLSYAIEKPANTARLVIMNTWMWPVEDDWYYRAFSRFMGGPAGRFLIGRFNFFARVVMRGIYGDRKKLTAGIHEHYLRPLGSTGERRQSWVLPGQILGSTDWLRSLWARREALREKPALILWGMKDIAFREKELRRWIEALPEAAVVRIPGAGHFVQEEAPDILVAEIEGFLDGMEGTAEY